MPTGKPGSSGEFFDESQMPNQFQLDSSVGLDLYTQKKKMGVWAHGTIYSAVHPGLQREVVIYVLDNMVSGADDVKEQFLHRAKILSQMNCSQIASTLEAGVVDDVAFIVQQRLESSPVLGFLPRSFWERWREGFFPSRRLTKFMKSAADGMHAIHQSGIVHGNLNENSLVVDQNDNLLVTETIGAATSDQGQSESQSNLMESDPSELNSIGFRDDVHDFGKLFYRITTGESLSDSADRSVNQMVDSLKSINVGLPIKLCEIIASCVATSDKSTFDFATIQQKLGDLANIETRKASWRQRIYSLGLGVIPTIICLAIVAVAAISQSEESNKGYSILAALGFYFVYQIGIETIWGTSLARMIFGIRLYEFSGDPAHWQRRLARAVLRLVIVALTFAGFALATRSLGIMEFDNPLMLMVVALMFAFIPIWILYLPALLIPCRWTVYDLLAGATWGETYTHATIEDGNSFGSASNGAGIDLTKPLDRVDQYEIHQPLGAGGMGSVYLARDKTLHRTVALKVLAGHLADDSETRSRFEREARLLAKISHPNVTKVYGTGFWRNAPYMTMELVDGSDLQKLVMQSGPVDVNRAWRWIIEAAQALNATHQKGIIHRDIKPANLLLSSEGRIKVTDFGISREIECNDENNDLTLAGSLVGTPTYMAPEQAMGRPVDARCDIYSLGMTLYFLLAGRPPFEGKNLMEILAQKMDSEPACLSQTVTELTPVQLAVIKKMTAKDPDDRYCDYSSLLADLRKNYAGDTQLAAVGRRLAAEACNLIVFILILNVCLVIATIAATSFGLRFGDFPAAVLLTLGFFVFFWMYTFGISRTGVTSGKKAMKLMVTRPTGQPVSKLRSLARLLVAYPALLLLPLTAILVFAGKQNMNTYYIPESILAANVVLLLISIVLMLATKNRKSLHDLAADTIVIRTDKT